MIMVLCLFGIVNLLGDDSHGIQGIRRHAPLDTPPLLCGIDFVSSPVACRDPQC
jgi:hypothetical protein